MGISYSLFHLLGVCRMLASLRAAIWSGSFRGLIKEVLGECES